MWLWPFSKSKWVVTFDDLLDLGWGWGPCKREFDNKKDAKNCYRYYRDNTGVRNLAMHKQKAKH